MKHEKGVFPWMLLAMAATLTSLLAWASPLAANDVVGDDGPHLRWSDGALEAGWVCDGQVVRRAIRAGADGAHVVAPACGYAFPVVVAASEPSAHAVRWSFDPVARIVALSDIHGQYDVMRALLLAHGVIDAQDRWSWGDGHLVLAGDIFDRGEQVNEALWLVYGLQQQAEAAAGRVHFLLGNHEAMVLYDDLRYVHPKYLAVAERFGVAHAELYGPDTVLGQWLRGLPAVVRIGDSLFVHGGLSEAFVRLGMDIDQTNARFRDSLGWSRDRIRADPVLDALYRGDSSPLWYRGYFLDDALSREDLDALVARWEVERIVVGHTSQQRIESLFGGRVLAVDSSIKNGESGELLFIEDGRLSRGLMDGSRLPLE